MAPHLPEPERTRRLDEAMRELLGVKDFTWWKQYAVEDLVAVLRETSLRRVEAELLEWRHNGKAVGALATRYATLGLPADALRIGRAARSSSEN